MKLSNTVSFTWNLKLINQAIMPNCHNIWTAIYHRAFYFVSNTFINIYFRIIPTILQLVNSI